jgi:anti-sigma B factor antagonist
MPERRCHIRGEFDVSAVSETRALLRRLIVSSNADVFVDCSRMTFIDSTGIAVLLEAHELLEKQDRKMLVANVRPGLRRSFELLGVLDLLTYDRSPVSLPSSDPLAEPATP